MACVCPVDRHMDDGSRAVTGDIGNAQAIHQLVISRSHLLAVHPGDDTVSADLLNVRHPGAVNLPAVSPPQAPADGMGRGALRQGRILHQLFILHLAVVDAADLKHPLGQGARLVKDHDLRLGEGLQIVGTFDQDPRPAGPADPRKET